MKKDFDIVDLINLPYKILEAIVGTLALSAVGLAFIAFCNTKAFKEEQRRQDAFYKELVDLYNQNPTRENLRKIVAEDAEPIFYKYFPDGIYDDSLPPKIYRTLRCKITEYKKQNYQ